jgi:hypothetical protein
MPKLNMGSVADFSGAVGRSPLGTPNWPVLATSGVPSMTDCHIRSGTQDVVPIDPRLGGGNSLGRRASSSLPQVGLHLSFQRDG